MSTERDTGNAALGALVTARGAGATAPAAATDPTVPYLLMRLGSRWFGLRAETVREVVARDVVTRVPGQPRHIRGVALLHGRLVPMVALDALLRIRDDTEAEAEVADGGERGRLVVLADPEGEIAILADDAKGVLHLPEPTPAPDDATAARFVRGDVRWEEQLVCVLDAAALVAAAIGARSE
ncbi:chemotaxis protein CheW [Haliangium sp.]|uniref:chemotaxis protein CheW n=1 Tax=Haliangium sp. TaxID=2663208 RepID=UPI003D0F405F